MLPHFEATRRQRDGSVIAWNRVAPNPEEEHDHTMLPHRWNVIPREAEIEEVQQC